MERLFDADVAVIQDRENFPKLVVGRTNPSPRRRGSFDRDCRKNSAHKTKIESK